MRGYKKNLHEVAHLVNTLEKSKKLAAGESLFINRLLKDLNRAIDTRNEKDIKKIIDHICGLFIMKMKD